MRKIVAAEFITIDGAIQNEEADGDHAEADVFAGFGGCFDVFGGCGGGCRERRFECVGGGV